MDKEILMWIQDGKVTKGELNFQAGTVTFYDKFENVLVHWSGLSPGQMKEIKSQIQKKLNSRKHVGFYYL